MISFSEKVLRITWIFNNNLISGEPDKEETG